ncbi:MAG TPA: hypothetical protein VFE64_03240 [Devosia sp.]|jgi:hypothetical protein|nr:hypothetical protein [Devosia sp.]
MRSVSAAKFIGSMSVAAAAAAGVLLATGVAVAASIRAEADLPMLSPELGDLALAMGLLAAFAAGTLLAAGLLMRPIHSTI